MNNRLRAATGDPLVTAFVSFAVGTFVIGSLLVLRGQSMRDLASSTDWLPGVPWWGLLGGVCGVGYVVSLIIGVPRIGVAMSFACVVLGQQIGAMAIDHFGLMGVHKMPIDPWRVVAITCILTGVWCMNRS
jgi:transporter family-2 protein